MNYHYEIAVLPIWGSLKISPGIFFVKEQFKENGQTTFSWKIEELQNLQHPTKNRFSVQDFPKEYRESFFRTKKWLVNNHPELML